MCVCVRREGDEDVCVRGEGLLYSMGLALHGCQLSTVQLEK